MLYDFFMIVLRPISHIFYKFKYKGKENVPVDCPLIVCCNHTSLSDVVLLGITINRNIHYMAKKELFKNKILGYIFKKVGAFPVDRDKSDITAIKTSLKILKNNEVLGIFPEGTRIKNNEHGEANIGVGLIAAKSKATILPVRIITENNEMKLFHKVNMVIGKPITNEQLNITEKSNEEYSRVSKKIMDRIYSLEF